MAGLAILSIAKGLNRGGYLGGCIMLIGLPLTFIAADCFFLRLSRFQLSMTVAA
jgi:hypothetical protein